MPSLGSEAATNLRAKLLMYRKRLLDLSLRNRLLSWKPSKRFTIELKEINLSRAYLHLVGEEGGSIDLVPEYDEETYAEAEADIPDRSGFMTGLSEEDLANKCLRTRREADALERDSGINYLHLCFGFLEWTEADVSEKTLRAPLILVPAKLIKNGTNKVTGLPEYAVEYDQTEVLLNPSLTEKLRQEFNIELPTFSAAENEAPDVATFTQFLVKMADLAKMRPKWKLLEDIRLTFLSFAKLRMYRDLDPNEWEADPLEENHLLQSLFGLASANELGAGAGNGQNVEENPKADGLPLVVLADSSQHQAVADAVHGANMVIEGPPGTGKSQTLTNIIACLMAEGKSVLFVAEKFAALDVVRSNLEGVGLNSFCFQLHGAKASKPQVYADLRKRLEATYPRPRRIDSVRAEWKTARKSLNDYVIAASKRIGPREETYFEICGMVEALRAKNLNPPLSMIGDGKLDRFQERESFLSDAEGIMTERQIPRKHGWLDLDAGSLSAGHEYHLTQPLPRVLQLLGFLLECENFVNGSLETTVPLKLEDCIGLTSTRLAPFALSDSILWSLKKALASADNRSLIEKCRIEAVSIHDSIVKASEILPKEKRNSLPTGLADALSRMSERTFFSLQLKDVSVESFKIVGENIARLTKLFSEAEKLQLDTQTTLAGATVLRDQLSLFRSLTPELQNDLSKECFQSGLSSLVDRSKQQGNALLERRAALSNTFSLVGNLPPPPELRQVREELKIYGSNGFARIFSGKYRQARKSTYRWLTLPSAYKFPAIIGELEKLEVLGLDEETYLSEPSNKKLGGLFSGVRTDWPPLEACVSWAQTAKNIGLTYGSVSKIIDLEYLPQIRELEDELSRLWNQINDHVLKIEACGAVEKDQLLNTPLKDLGKVLKQWHAWLEAYIAPTQNVIAGEVTVKSLLENLQSWVAIDDREKALSQHKPLRKCLGNHADGMTTDWKAIKATESWIDTMHAVGLPHPWFEGLLDLDDEAIWAQVIQVVSQSAEAWQEILNTFEGFDGHLVEPQNG